jgi:hypothetical protein
MSEIRAWTDSEIRSEGSPSAEVIALAVESGPAAAISLLHQLGSGADGRSVGRRVYAHLSRALCSGVISVEVAGRGAARLALENAAPSSQAAAEAARFDDAVYLAKSGTYGNLNEVASEIEEHLKRYAA